MEKEQNVEMELEDMVVALDNNLRVLTVLVRAFKHEQDADERANILDLISLTVRSSGDMMVKSAKIVEALADFY